jgi:ADP-heptose:LPS heptosyltransferase
VRRVETSSFRDACRLLSNADLFVGTDGGLHHAAAALGKRAVVVWGGLVSPKILGYDSHINLHSGTHSCGSEGPCLHCRKALDWVTVDMVVSAIESLCDRDSGVSRESRSRGVDEGTLCHGMRQPVSGGLGECSQGA